MAVVKSQLTRQLASGVIKARARYYRLRLERACTLARSQLLASEAAPIEPGLLGDTIMHHAGSSAFDNPADDDGAYCAHPELGGPDMHGDDTDRCSDGDSDTRGRGSALLPCLLAGNMLGAGVGGNLDSPGLTGLDVRGDIGGEGMLGTGVDGAHSAAPGAVPPDNAAPPRAARRGGAGLFLLYGLLGGFVKGEPAPHGTMARFVYD